MHTDQKRRAVLAAAFLSLGAVTACAAPPLAAYPPVPPPRVEVLPPRGAPGEVLQPGHWHWDGREYVWNPGRWLVPPPHMAHFVPGHWHSERGAWVWVPGHWAG